MLTLEFEYLVVPVVPSLLDLAVLAVPSLEKERLLLEKRREQGTVAQP
jgi:hypothetical protein